jgi:hypothetical protein
MLRNTVGFVAPFLYAAGLVIVMMGAMAALSFVERTVGFYERDGGSPNFTTLHYNGDVVGATATLVIGGVVFGLLALMLVRLERLHRPAIRDHLRHCTALYVILGTLMNLLLATYEDQAAYGVSLGYAVAVGALFTVCYAIAIDALILWRQRQRCARAGFGESA